MSKVRDFKVTELSNMFKDNITTMYEGKDEIIIKNYEDKLSDIDVISPSYGELYLDLHDWMKEDQEFRDNNREYGSRYCNQFVRIINDDITDDKRNSFGDRRDAEKIYFAFYEQKSVKVKDLFKHRGHYRGFKNPLKEAAWFATHSMVTSYFLNVDNIYKICPVGKMYIDKWNSYINEQKDIPDSVKNYLVLDGGGTSEFQKEYAKAHDLCLMTDSDETNQYTLNINKMRQNSDEYFETIRKGHEEAEKIIEEMHQKTEQKKAEMKMKKERKSSKYADIADYRSVYGSLVTQKFNKNNSIMSPDEINNLIDLSRGKKITITIDDTAANEKVVINDGKNTNKEKKEELKKETSKTITVEEANNIIKDKKEEKKAKDFIEKTKKGAHDHNPNALAVVQPSIIPEMIDEAALANLHPEDDEPEADPLAEAVVAEVVKEEDVPPFAEDIKLAETIIDAEVKEAKSEEEKTEKVNPTVTFPLEAYKANNDSWHQILPELKNFTDICNSIGNNVMYDQSTEYPGLISVLTVDRKFNTVNKKLMIDPRIIMGDSVRVVTQGNKNGDIRKEMFIPISNKVLITKLLKGQMTNDDRKKFNESVPRCLGDFREKYAFLDRVDLRGIADFTGKLMNAKDWNYLIINISNVLVSKDLPICRYRVADVKSNQEFKLICDDKVLSSFKTGIFDEKSHIEAAGKKLAVIYDRKKYGEKTPFVYGTVSE